MAAHRALAVIREARKTPAKKAAIGTLQTFTTSDILTYRILILLLIEVYGGIQYG